MVRLEKLGKFKKLIHLIGARTRDLPAYSLVAQPLCYRVPRLTSFFSTQEDEKNILLKHSVCDKLGLTIQTDARSGRDQLYPRTYTESWGKR
jgi:hypothetical protein